MQRVSSRLLALVWDARDPDLLTRFWTTLLARHPPADGPQLGLRFVPDRGRPPGRPRVHLHLTSTAPEDQQATVAAALGLGARPLDVGQRPEEGHVVLADPEGNAFCVIEPGNAFLAGCGFLGELAGEGTREVGLFWSRALEWPLVWDQDGETAIQAPAGGTKIAWGGPPVAPQDGPSRQRLQLMTSGGASLGSEIDRLLSLGARRLEDDVDGGALLVDPDGNAFHLSAG